MEGSMSKKRDLAATARAEPQADGLSEVEQDPEFESSSACKSKRQCIEQTAEEVSVPVPTDKSKVTHFSNRVCDLPDEMLLHIMSCLPLKDAVRTSVLSKRWEKLWAFVPHLQFENSDRYKRELFLRLVERACANRNGYTMRAFSLKCDIYGEVSHIKKLITAVVECGVQDLSLFLDNPKRGYKFPTSVYMSATLERLRVQSHYLFKLPTSTCLSKLKVLTLGKVIFADDNSVEKLFSTPLLEELKIERCDCRKLTSIHVSAPKLQHLCISHLRQTSYDLKVQINGTCLKSFHYFGKLINEHCISGDTRQLVEAKLLLDPGGRHQYNLLWVFSNVKELTLSEEIIKGLDTRYGLPLFSNMTKLEVDGLDSASVNGLWALLRSSPHLRSLNFTKGFRYCPQNGGDEFLHPVPSCFLTELEKISLLSLGWRHRRRELFMIRFFLENAIVLREMVIRMAKDCEVKENLLEVLSTFCKGSEECQISLQSDC